MNSIAMILNPNQWPQWPYLPLKNRRIRDASGHMAQGVLREAGLLEPRAGIFEFAEGANLFALDEFQGTWTPIDPAELLANGWEVD